MNALQKLITVLIIWFMRIPSTKSKQKRLSAVSMFSNCGGGDFGFAQAGFAFEVIAEIDAERLEVAAANHPRATPVLGDVRDTWCDIVSEFRLQSDGARLDLLAACPPCQGMSSAQSRRGKAEDADAGSRDDRNLLVIPIAEVAKRLMPRAIVIENVNAFLSRKVRHPQSGSPISAARLLIDALGKHYFVYPASMDLADYGVPQTRKRAFLTFLHRDEPANAALAARGASPYPCPTHAIDWGARHVSIEEALERAGLPSLDAASARRAKSDDPLHFVPVWSGDRYRMVAAIPAMSGQSAWQNARCLECKSISDNPQLAACPKCGARLPRPVTKAEDGTLRLIRGFKNSSYRRMRPEKPAATITTASGRVGSDLTIHPSQNRVLSPRECAVLQTFPNDFCWGDALKRKGHSGIRAMIGEAVPPAFTKAHGTILSDLLQGKQCRDLLPVSDKRSERASRKLFEVVPV